MILDCAHYRDGRRQDAGAIPLEEAAARCTHGRLRVARDVRAPARGARRGPRELRAARARGRGRPELPPAPEDRAVRGGDVKLRDPAHRALRRGARGGRVRRDQRVPRPDASSSPCARASASDLHGARLRLEQHPELLHAGTAAALWAILDKVVDDYAPVVEGLERDIEEVEATVFAGSVAPTERIYSLRREATDFYRAVHPLLAPLETVERGGFADVERRAAPVLPRRPRPPAPGQRGGHRPARPARRHASRPTWR